MTRTCTIRVHNLEQAQAAIDFGHRTGIDFVLLCDPGAATFAGVGFLHAMSEQLGQNIIVDCADRAGLVLAALRQGLKEVVFSGPEPARLALAEIAEHTGGTIRDRVPTSDIELCPDDAAEFVIQRWYKSPTS